ncbi:membrane protein [Mycolicibacterium goodii]|uniref:Membrane protein n=1 Tax=Mycolicibacterium goodii TaxID=134601 RepID=A0A0K0XDF1_MYCGD|nr:membrane protein [Mycolicibacterium goodii]
MALVAIAFVALAAGFAAWLGIRMVEAKSALEHARDSAQQVKDAVLQGDSEGAVQAAGRTHNQAAAAHEATHSWPWAIAASVPWLGSPLETTREISDVVLGLATDVLTPVAQVGAVMSPNDLMRDGRLDVELLRAKQPELSSIAGSAARLDVDAAAISEPAFVNAVGDARTSLQNQTAELAEMLGNTSLAAQLVPPMMGADGPRDYFMGFQTNAEARGTGGLLGGFGVLHFDNGKFTVDELGANTELDKQFTPIDLGAEYNDQYGFTNPTTDFRNSNLSSHFPYAAQIWKSMWAQQTGVDVDGVIAIDPVALSYILGAVGPVTLPDGEKINSSNVVELTESTAYQRFPDDQPARKRYLQDIANAVVKKMAQPVESPRKLLDALGKAAGERRIAVWSANPQEQGLLERTPLAHTIPGDPAPYAEVVVNNLAGNKLDYYLTREIEYVADGCSDATRLSTITVRLTNTLGQNSSLPRYVSGAMGLKQGTPVVLPDGTMVTSVRLLATQGANLVSATANGQRTPVITSTERGHPGFEIQVAIPPTKSGELQFRLSEPTAAGAARVPVQPLVDDVVPKVSVPQCSGVVDR